MLSVLGGLLTAVSWTVATLMTTRASRTIGARATLAWVMLVGLVAAIPILVLNGPPPALDPPALGWLAIVGVGNVGGLALVYSALRTGRVGVVAALVSTEGAVSAVIAFAAGERLAPLAAVGLGIIAVGVLLGALREGGSDTAGTGGASFLKSPAARFAGAAAIAFGVSLYATGRVGAVLPIAVAILPARVVGVAFVALPLLATGRLRLPKAVAPYVVTAGIAEIVGVAAFVTGAREGIAVTSVIASQFVVLTAVGAAIVYRERLLPAQRAGVVMIAAGVAILTAVRA